MKTTNLYILVAICICGSVVAADFDPEKLGGSFTNSIGMKMVRIEPGSFVMGYSKTPLPEELTTPLSYPTRDELIKKYPHGDPDKFEKRLTSVVGFQIDRDALFVALQLHQHGVGVPGLVTRGAADPTADGCYAGGKNFRTATHGGFDLHNGGAQISQYPRSQRSCPDVSQIENSDVPKRPVSHQLALPATSTGVKLRSGCGSS